MFGENIDVSLYYMLEGNRLYKKHILNILKELPLSFIENIRHDYNYGLNVKDIDQTDEFHNIQSKKFDDVCYRFYFNGCALNILKIKNNIVIPLLVISPIYPDSVKSMKEGSTFYIGSIGLGEYCFTEIDYDLNKSKNGYNVTHNYVLLRNLIETPSCFRQKVKKNFDDKENENYFAKKLTKNKKI